MLYYLMDIPKRDTQLFREEASFPRRPSDYRRLQIHPDPHLDMRRMAPLFSLMPPSIPDERFSPAGLRPKRLETLPTGHAVLVGPRPPTAAYSRAAAHSVPQVRRSRMAPRPSVVNEC